MLRISKQVLIEVLLWLSFLPEAAQITGKKACERMKDVLRRGVDRQVAEGMFERAQERMQHQFQQLKVFDLCSLHSVPEDSLGSTGKRGRDGGSSSCLSPDRAGCLLQSGLD